MLAIASMNPGALRPSKVTPFRVFTPFWRRLAENYRSPAKSEAPKHLAAPGKWPRSVELRDFQVTAPWADEIGQHWQPGETGAQALLAALKSKLPGYSVNRDRPSVNGTSRLSPHLAWGEISVHEIWRHLAADGDPAQNGFLRELGWRDFNTHLLYHFPKLPTRNWNSAVRPLPF